MKKMSVNDAATHFGISKEAIHNRIRRGSLESSIENGIKMVMVDTNTQVKSTRNIRAKTSLIDERYYKLLEEQNVKLQSRVEVLESETRSLRDQKELMLIQEREKIEQIYKEKDEQLKNILATLSSQFMLSQAVVEEDALEIETLEIETIEIEKSTPISLKKFIKSLELSEKKAQKIKNRFEKIAQSDERMVLVGKKIYLDTKKYDYKDLTK